MTDFFRLRHAMVEGQLRPNNITDHRVLAAMLNVPREKFVPGTWGDLAYRDGLIEDGAFYPILAPLLIARLVQAGEVRDDSVVLNTVCSRGYLSAVLARLAGSVVALHPDTDQVDKISAVIDALELSNIACVQAQPAEGFAKEAPFDVIMVGASIDQVPQILLNQLKVGGRLVTILGGRPMGQLTVIQRVQSGFATRELGDAVAPSHPHFTKEPAFEL